MSKPASAFFRLQKPFAHINNAPAHRLIVKRDIFGDTQVRNNIDFLRDERHACSFGLRQYRSGRNAVFRQKLMVPS